MIVPLGRPSYGAASSRCMRSLRCIGSFGRTNDLTSFKKWVNLRFIGEGHRKVWARLRILRDIRVSRTRVLRLMRENALLSPHRRPHGKSAQHDGTITTGRPNEMWGTDGVRIETVDDGWVWVFSAVDHCDACCVRIPAVKTGNPVAALQPIAQGLLGEFGGTGAQGCPGLTLRMDHGSQYTADDFLNQVRFWGVTPSFAFVAEPQT